MGDAAATPKGSYRELNAGVLAGPAWPPQSSQVGAVAGISPPPPAQHGVAGPLPHRPQVRGAPLSPLPPKCGSEVPSRSLPLRGRLTPKGCGLGLPARFFFEIEGVFMSSLFFLENMVRPGQEPAGGGPGPAVWGSQQRSRQRRRPPVHIVASHPLPSCQAHVTGPALIGVPSPPQEKAAEVVTQTRPPPSLASACPSAEWASRWGSRPRPQLQAPPQLPLSGSLRVSDGAPTRADTGGPPPPIPGGAGQAHGNRLQRR